MIDALFGSKTRVKLLHLFLNNPGRAFYVREITRKIDEQINSVRRELANMLSMGIIHSEESNNRLYYQINVEYAYYEPLRAIFADSAYTAKSKVTGSSKDWESRLKPLGDVRAVVLSGKLVKGSSSDIDILIVGNTNKTQVKKFISEIEREDGLTIDYTLMEYQDFYYRLSVRDKFVMSVLSGSHSVVYDIEGILDKI